MSNKPTLYWLHSHFLLSTGGTRFIFEVISRLSTHYQVVVVVEKAAPEWVAKYRQLDVPVIQISSHTSTSLYYWALFPVFFMLNWFKLRRLLPKNAVVISSMFPMPALTSLLPVRQIYYCFEPFAFFYDKDLINSFPTIKQAFLRALATAVSPLDRWSVANQDRLLAINPSVGHHIKQIYDREPDGYTYLGVDLEFFKPEPASNRSRSRASETILFHSTDYSPLKGTQYLIDAIKLLKAEPIKLHISESVSDHQQRREIEKQISLAGLDRQVEFKGHVPYQDLPAVYSQSDIYCFTGDPASTGATAASLSVLEASATQLPVIRSIGNDDEVIPGKTGLLVDPRQTEELAAAIRYLAANPKLRKEMGRAGRRHVTGTYTWDKVAQVVQDQIELLRRD